MDSQTLPEDTLRCWVVGCSTGEEAYSFGILISEAMEKTPAKYLNVQIFATDIDESAIESARKGVYPDQHSRRCIRRNA